MTIAEPPRPWNSEALTRWPGVTVPIDDCGGRYVFDPDEADRAVDFAPTFLRHLKGEVAGHPFELLPWQRELVVRPLFGWKRKEDGLRRFRKVFVLVPKKQAKALALDTPIPTPEGWSTMGDLRPGDFVFGRDGRPVRVLAATEVMHGHECFRVRFCDGTSVVADAGHRWAIDDGGGRRLLTTADLRTAGPGPRIPKAAGQRTARGIVAVDPVPSVPVRCIQVDAADGLFLAGDGMVPTHNSELCSALGLYLTFCDREPGAEVIACAADREQAMEVFREARDMAANSRRLAARAQILRKAIVVPETRSAFRVVSSEVRGRHGPSIHGLIFDEFHALPSRDLYDALSKGIAARRQPVVIIITTAGDDTDSVCYEEYEYAKRVIGGIHQDETYLPVIFEPKPEDDWRDPAVWHRVNPALGVTVKEEYFRNEVRAAEAEPRKQGPFKRYHLNIWTQAKETWIPVEWWNECPPLPESLAGRPVAGGLDLSSTTDLTAFVLVFRLPESRLEGETVPTVEAVEMDPAGAPVKKVLSINYDLAVLPFLWMPEDRLHERSKEDGVDYGVWVRAGHLRTTPGSVVDYDFIFRTIVDELVPRYRVKEIGYDPWNALQFALQLEKAGLQPVEVRQGPKTLSTACKVLHALTRARRVHHDGNRAMAWCVANAAVKEDENENIRPIKANPKKRIDGVVAAVTALSRLMVLPNRPGSPYVNRGVRTAG